MITVWLVVATALLAYVVWGKSRRRSVAIEMPPDGDIESLFPSLAALTWGRIIEGNRVTILQDRDFFNALLDEIKSAQHHVHLETFVWNDGMVSERLASALMEKAAVGVIVRLLVDQRGAITTDPRLWATMRKSGCDARVFHRARFGEFALYNHRDHR